MVHTNKKKPIVKKHKNKKPVSLEKSSDDTRHYKESIPEFKQRRDDFRAAQKRKRELEKQQNS